jgi:dipeptidyl-peptidase-4
MTPERHPSFRPARMVAAGLILLTLPLGAQGTKRLTYGQVYLKEKPPLMWRLERPEGWLDAKTYLRTEPDEKSKTSILYKVDAGTGDQTVLLDYGAIQKQCPEGLAADSPADTAADFSGLIYSFADDLYYYAVKPGALRRLTNDPAPELNPTFSPDGRRVAFTRRNDLFSVNLATGLETRLTTDGSDTILNGRASWVYYEEILGRRSDYKAFWWSPDSKRIAFLRFDNGPVPIFPLFSSDGQHGRLELTRYPAAGDPNPKVRFGFTPAAEAKVVWADFDENADQYLAWPVWLPDSSGLSVQWMNRGQDDLKIYLIDLLTGAKSDLYEERQPAWVEFFEDLHFFEDGSGFLLRSDKSGWRHLYVYGMDGRLRKQITSGDWTVESIARVDQKSGTVYFMGDKGLSTETHLFRVGLDGSGLLRMTREPGRHSDLVAPGGRYFLDTFSSLETPSRRDLCRADGTVVRTVEESSSLLLKEYALGKRELFHILTSDGWSLPASWVLPPDFDPAKKYPVLFTIYSGPGTTDVSNSFPRLSEFFLAQQGIIVFSVDHRGSSHFGKEGESLMYRCLGKWEIHDLSEAVQWLRGKPFVDPARVGITGGSYGGYTTCLALTKGADYFTHGLASSSVTDWRLYDSVYTERYMDTPSENPEGYRDGSVQTYADRLKGALFMEHGDMDDNVHMQNTVQLIGKFMAAGRDFGFMLYPDQRHGFRGKEREFSDRAAYRFWMERFFGR